MKDPISHQAAGVTTVSAVAVTPAVCHSVIYQLCQNTEDAFYLFDIGDVIEKYRNWTYLMPRVRPFYAVKCNDDPVLLSVLASLGCGFDCASKGELSSILALGVAPEDIIFANPCKPASHVRAAAQRRVRLMTFDNEAELVKIQRLAPDARLVLRIRVDSSDARVSLGIKFGAEPEVAAPHLLKLALAMGLTVVGVSFHVGSDCADARAYSRAIEAARQLFDEAARQGARLSLLDIGGGFPGDGGAAALLPFADAVNAALEAHFGDLQVAVIAEPGRYMAASAFTLATQVTSVRRSAERVEYYINDGIYGAFSGILYDHQVVTPRPLVPASDQTDCDTISAPATIWGPTCDSLDKICEDVRSLPPLSVGSWLLWDNMGAYTLAAASTFNGFPPARVHPVVAAEHSETVRAAVSRLVEAPAWSELPPSPPPAPAAAEDLETPLVLPLQQLLLTTADCRPGPGSTTGGTELEVQQPPTVAVQLF